MTGYDPEYVNMLGAFSDFEDWRDARLDRRGSFVAAVIPLRDLVIFPRMITPLMVGRPKSLAALQAAREGGESLVSVLQIDPDLDDPTGEDLFSVGVELALGRSIRVPDGTTSVLAQGRRRVQVVEFLQDEPYLKARFKLLREPREESSEIEAHMRAVLTLFERVVEMNRSLPEDAYQYAMDIDEPGWLADLVATTIGLNPDERQELLETPRATDRLMRVSILLGKELEVLQIEDQIHNRVQEEVDKTQREMFLREQMRAIQRELGEADLYLQEIEDLREKISKKTLPDAVRLRANKEVARLTDMPPMAPEVGIIRTYIDWLLDLPWTEQSEDNLEVKRVAEVLDADHYGLKKAKDRIIEHIAVRKLAGEKMRSPILCFVGPPGTGKTSLGRSIARALGREFVRVSLGGVRDEAEIRGHRRTYIGALPGRIVQALRRAGTINPVFMLDEIDKLGQDFRGDPSSALLEVLDPEQNHAFSDHYLEVDYDLSKVMFITTANSTDPLTDALLDRLEVIEFGGYVEEEKVEIARRFLTPKELEATGIKGVGVSFEDSAVKTVIRDYTYEAGVRNLEREIANVCRKIARYVAEGKRYPAKVTPAVVHKFLGPSRNPGPVLAEVDEIGFSLGMAWTEGGGDLSPVEVSLVPGKGSLTMTGSMGDIMQESAQAAYSYLRSLAGRFEIDPESFENTDVHVHCPEGAIPKDGPSAGVTIATALVSAFTNAPVRKDVAMTGEVTLRGRVLPVGGVREKLLAALRAGITTVIVPAENVKDLTDLPPAARKAAKVVAVKHMDEVLDVALLEPIEEEGEPAPAPDEEVKA